MRHHADISLSLESTTFAQFSAPQLDVRAAGPALDLTTDLVASLTAEAQRLRGEVKRLRGELHDMQLQVDDLLDRESMFAGAECMERLTTAASFERFGAPRARHLSVCPAADSTAPGSVVA